MRTPRLLYGAMLLVALTVSCRDINFTMENYKKAIRSGWKKIPESKQMEELFEKVDHTISYHGSRAVGNDWSTTAYFEGRYVLTMQVPVRMGYQFDEVLEVLDEPTYYLKEVKTIKYYGDGSQIGASFNTDGQHTFSAEKWAKVYEADGDFSVIGINLKKNQPVEDFDKFVKAVRKDIVKVEEADAKEEGADTEEENDAEEKGE